MTDYVKLGVILKQAREEAKYTQKEVADILGLTSSNVSSWERGKSRIDIDSYAKLCKLYGINSVAPLISCSTDFCDVATPEISKKSPSLSDEDERLLHLFHRLDSWDQGSAVGYIEGMLTNEKYRKEEQSGNAAG